MPLAELVFLNAGFFTALTPLVAEAAGRFIGSPSPVPSPGSLLSSGSRWSSGRSSDTLSSVFSFFSFLELGRFIGLGSSDDEVDWWKLGGKPANKHCQILQHVEGELGAHKHDVLFALPNLCVVDMYRVTTPPSGQRSSAPTGLANVLAEADLAVATGAAFPLAAVGAAFAMPFAFAATVVVGCKVLDPPPC